MHVDDSSAARGAGTHGKLTATPQRGTAQADTAGAALLVAGIVGGIAWGWELVRSQSIDEPGSLEGRIDLLASQAMLLLLSAAVAGIGVGLRAMAGIQTRSPARPVLGRPVGRMLLAVAATLLVFLGGMAIVGDGDDRSSDLRVLLDDAPNSDNRIVLATPALTNPVGQPEPTLTVKVHSDGCGVIRTGEIGDEVIWTIKDQDGFEVLARNAAGETQYRYFEPGTYTVVLESWGDRHYVAVSNEVTITC